MSASHPGIGATQVASNISPEATIPYLINCLSLISWELVTAFPQLGAVAFTVVGGRTTYPSGVSHPPTSLHYTALLVGTAVECGAYDGTNLALNDQKVLVSS